MVPTPAQPGNAARPQARPDQPLNRANALPESPTEDRPRHRRRSRAARTPTSASQHQSVRPRPTRRPQLCTATRKSAPTLQTPTFVPRQSAE